MIDNERTLIDDEDKVDDSTISEGNSFTDDEGKSDGSMKSNLGERDDTVIDDERTLIDDEDKVDDSTISEGSSFTDDEGKSDGSMINKDECDRQCGQ